MGFLLFICIVSGVMAIASIIGIFLPKTRILSIIGVIFFIAVLVFLLNFIRDHEEKYYRERGSIHDDYGVVRSVAYNRIKIYSGELNTNVNSYRLPSGMSSNFNIGDVIYATYVDGIFHSYLISSQKFVPVK